MDFPAKGYRELKEDCPVTEIEVNLEQLRDQNEALRDVGKFWRATAIHLLQECCDLERIIRKLEKE